MRKFETYELAARPDAEMLLDIINCDHPDPRGISVIVSLYNYEVFIVACLESVGRQVYPHLELIVVDDASIGFNCAKLAGATCVEI